MKSQSEIGYLPKLFAFYINLAKWKVIYHVGDLLGILCCGFHSHALIFHWVMASKMSAWAHSKNTMNIEKWFDDLLWRHQWRHQHEKYFSGTICDDLFIFDVKIKLYWKFEIFKMAAFLRVRRSFKPEVISDIVLHTRIGNLIPYVLSYWSKF